MGPEADPGTVEVVVFVYGSLLRGEANDHWLREAEYLGAAVTEPCYTLVDLGEYPALVDGGSQAVRGELYRVGPELLARLDVFEDVPELYRREGIRLRGQSAQGYLLQPEHAGGKRSVESGDWRRR